MPPVLQNVIRARISISGTDIRADVDIDEVDNIPVLTPRAAIRDAIRAGLPGQLIEQAQTTARRRELIDPITEARLRVELADRNQRKYAHTKDKAV